MNTQTKRSLTFRKDIQGLRAIAVVAVIIFHFYPSLLQGGFAGVDIFFVISGYLMTGIIFKGIEKGNFSILKFYVSRANRIIPALAALCLVVFILGWFILVPDDFRKLGKHIASSISFLSNIIYLRESGYFDAASHEKWLLHTWSLSVEWQFYIIYPIIVALLCKFLSLKVVKLFVALGAVVGFIVSVYMTHTAPDAAYYLLSSRAWEMMVGGCAFLFPIAKIEKRSKLFELIGLVLILLSYLLISSKNLWPGTLALFPTIGAFLIIQANRQNSVVTSNLISQKLGDCSYSIYLWHWPIVVFVYYYSLGNLYSVLGITLSILLGFLSRKYIEKIQFRSSFEKLKDIIFYCKPIYLVVFVGILGVFAFKFSNLSYMHLTSSSNKLVADLQNKIVMPHRRNGYCFYSFNDDSSLKIDLELGTNCKLGDKSSSLANDTLLFGDSFAGTYDPLLDEVYKENNRSYDSVSTNWCFPSLDENFTGPKTHSSYQQCLLNRKYLKSVIDTKKYKNIIFAGSWNSVDKDGFMQSSMDMMLEAQKQGINVFIMPTPLRYKKDPTSKYFEQVYKQHTVNLQRYISDKTENNQVNDTLQAFANQHKGIYFIKRDDIFNKDGLFDYNGVKVPYTLDGRHMSLLGSLKAKDVFVNSEEYKVIQPMLF